MHNVMMLPSRLENEMNEQLNAYPDRFKSDGLTWKDGGNQARKERNCPAFVLWHDLCRFPAIDRNGLSTHTEKESKAKRRCNKNVYLPGGVVSTIIS